MIPIAIVSHESRTKRADKLAHVLGAEFMATDDGTLGAGLNHDRAWRWLAEGDSDWSVVLEDDALPIKGFRKQLEMVLKAAPSPVVSLYLGRARPPHWQPQIMRVAGRRDVSFLLGSTLLHHVGVAMKTKLIPSMLLGRDNRLPVDESIGAWAKNLHIPVAYSWPSIVDHDTRLRTTIEKRSSGYSGETSIRDQQRKAWWFGSREAWLSGSLRIPEPDI